jgi:hypothetical protein
MTKNNPIARSKYNIGELTVNIELMWQTYKRGKDEPHKFYIYRQYTNIVFILQ